MLRYNKGCNSPNSYSYEIALLRTIFYKHSDRLPRTLKAINKVYNLQQIGKSYGTVMRQLYMFELELNCTKYYRLAREVSRASKDYPTSVLNALLTIIADRGFEYAYR